MSRSSSHVAVVDDLHVTFRRRGRDVAAIRGASLEVGEGEIVAMVGESGCGKTTLGLALTGLLLDQAVSPTISGSIDVLGTDVLSASPDARRKLRRDRVRAIFQDPMSSLNPTMRIGRQLIETSGSDGASVELLELVGITGAQRRLRSYPHELSGGQRQRVMIAMAIARKPALVVADEPTTALDVTIQAQLLRLIADLREETGTAFVFVTHDLGVAAQVADRIVVFYAGRVVEQGAASEVLANPAHPYTMALLRSRIAMDAERDRPLPALGGEPPPPDAAIDQCPFAPRCEFVAPQCLEGLPELRAVAGSASVAACVRADEIEPTQLDAVAAGAWPEQAHADDGLAMRVENVEKEFRMRGHGARHERLRALHAVSLELRAGECLGIVGESGCGKSTLLRVMAGLTAPDAGTCELVGGGAAQMVFQDATASLTPWLTVGEQIGERLPRGTGRQARRQAVADALRAVGLAPVLAEAKSRHLSGGQRQRVALARAIVIPPRVLLCDEPTSALDVSLAATVLNLIGELRRELGMTVVFVTHDLAAARLIADRIAVMYLGRIVELGPADRVAEDPGHPYTKALIAAVPGADALRPKAKGELPDPLHPPTGCPYHPRCAEATSGCDSYDPVLVPFGHDARRQGACVHLGS